MSLTTQINPEALAAKIDALIERRQFDAATKLIPAVAAIAPEQPLSAALAVRLAVAQGDHAKADDALDAALAAWPDASDLLRLRAQFALTKGEFPAAAQAAAGSIIADPHDASAKSLLGRALLALGNAAQAQICLREAIAGNPHDAPAVLALAETMPEQASLLLAAASARLPRDASLRNALIRVLINTGESEAACQTAEAAHELRALDTDGYVLAGHAAAQLDNWPQARRYWQAALRLAHRNPSALYRLAADRACGPDRLNPAMIAMADDARANTIELVAMAGGTILPGRVCAALAAAEIAGPALDLGCGTGLCAVASNKLGLVWHGVEAASRLAAIADDRGLYSILHKSDPISFVEQNPGQWQAISFNFTAGLVRHLNGLFNAFAARLASGGIAIGAIIIRKAGEFGAFGCFEHSEAELHAAARDAGLAVTAGAAETLMTVDGLAMIGRIVELRKA